MSAGAGGPLSHQNDLVVSNLPARRAARGAALLEGRALALDVLGRDSADCEFLFAIEGAVDRELAGAAEARGVPVRLITARALGKLSTTQSPAPVALLVRAPTVAPLDHAAPPPRLLVMQGIADPGNAGTLVRAAAAFRFAVALDGECVTTSNEKFLRATAGVAFAPSMLFRAEPGAAPQLAAAGLLLALDASAPATLAATLAARGKRTLAIVVGNESRGVDWVRWGSATRVRIPMAGGVESLNAAVSGAIAMYEAARSST